MGKFKPKHYFGLLFLIVGALSFQVHLNSAPYIEHQEVILLSYIPSIEATSTQQLIYPISLKKINYFENYEFAYAEDMRPVLDSVLYIPKRFRARDLV
jgi:hypothetical protein